VSKQSKTKKSVKSSSKGNFNLKSLEPILNLIKKISGVFLFVLKYFSLGVHYILEFIFVTIVYTFLKGIVVFFIKFFKKIQTWIIKRYKNSKMYKNKLIKLENERNALISDVEKKNLGRLEKEVTFRYKVKTQEGKMKTGYMNGLSKLDVMAFLTNENYTVYKIETSKLIQFLYGRSSFIGVRMKTKDIIFWLTQLSTYIKSGIPLTDALKILSKQVGKSNKQQKLFESLIYELTMGNSFSEAMRKQRGVFPPLLINMLKAAEATGELEETLDEMAEYYTEMHATRKQMISAMTYPSIITIFSMGVVVFIILYIIPKFTGIYDQLGAEIGGITKVVINISDFLQENITNILFAIAIVVFATMFSYKKIKVFRAAVQNLLMRLPVIGKVIIYNELTIFTKTFASLLKNNVFITESMDILSRITNNEIYRSIMFKTINNIAKGDKISDAFKDHWAIPEVAYYMIVTGESTGELPQMMDKVSVYYQQEHRSRISAMKSFIEPTMIVFLAISVGTIIISVIMPMFSLYEMIG